MTDSTILITTLAEYQTEFWLPVGVEIEKRGRDVAFLSFDDRSTEMLRGAGLTVTSLSEARVPDPSAIEGALERAHVDNANRWFGHEKAAFNLRNVDAMRRKLARCIIAAEQALDRAGPEAVLVQELGGFLSVVGSFFAAQRQGVTNWFIEPSFFRGRFLLTANSFAAPVFTANGTARRSPAFDRYIADTLESGAIVIPEKDRHHYRPALSKVANARNARRLIEKLLDKHVYGKTQEFGHIRHHVAQHARMYLNSRRVRPALVPPERLERFIYYPFHVPGDVALTLRSPEYLDQLALVDYLCRTAPDGLSVAVKEHPAMIGAIDAGRLLDLGRQHENLAILPPSMNNYAVLRAAEAVITVNSKSGAEAGLIGKPVVVLGDAFYREAPFVTPADRLADLGDALARARSQRHDQDATLDWFAGVWENARPGELYVANPQNVSTFVTSLLEGIARDA